MLTRWDKWYSQSNLSQDERILAAPPSGCAHHAATVFLSRGRTRILDLACGVGRDTLYLEKRGLDVIGVDASMNGLRAASRIKLAQGAAAQLIAADARSLPFEDGSFEGVYCFGLLHEFTSERKDQDVAQVMAEAGRVLCKKGVLVLAVLSGEAEEGLPSVQLFTRQMLEQITEGWQLIEIKAQDDIGCTNRSDYPIWCGTFER